MIITRGIFLTWLFSFFKDFFKCVVCCVRRGVCGHTQELAHEGRRLCRLERGLIGSPGAEVPGCLFMSA